MAGEHADDDRVAPMRVRWRPRMSGALMCRFPRLAHLLAPILMAIAVETVAALEDGSYFAVPPERPWDDFPEYHDPHVGVGGGFGGEG